MIEPILEADRLLLYGMLDRAEALYQGVADRDPRNAFAFIGLARVAVERGDDAAAFRYSSEAARIDPENAVAHAMAARTGELMRKGASIEGVETAAKPSLVSRVLRR